MTKWSSKGNTQVQNMPRAFKLLKRRFYHDAGETVYPCKRPNRELEKECTEKFGGPCVTMTTDPKGDFPAFVVPKEYLEEIPYE